MIIELVCQAQEFGIRHEDNKEPLRDFDPRSVMFEKTILVAMRKID